jgi:hypothetical protein
LGFFAGAAVTFSNTKAVSPTVLAVIGLLGWALEVASGAAEYKILESLDLEGGHL